MPRLTNEPASMSSATSCARVLRSTFSLRSITSLLVHARVRPVQWTELNGDHHIGVDRCGHNVFWIKGSGRQNLFDLCNGLLGRGGHDRTEVACRLAVHQVAFFIGLERFDQCDVTVDRVLQHIVATVDLTNFFALGQPGPVTGWCKESANACTGGTQALGKVALWYEFQLNFAGTVGLVEMPGV